LELVVGVVVVVVVVVPVVVLVVVVVAVPGGTPAVDVDAVGLLVPPPQAAKSRVNKAIHAKRK